MNEITRRSFVGTGMATAVVALIGGQTLLAAPETFEVTLSDAEWRKRLSPAAYATLRHANTERAFTSPLNDEHRLGTFLCAGCALPLFASKTKFDSGTGWPSFWRPLPNAVRTRTDYEIGVRGLHFHRECSRACRAPRFIAVVAADIWAMCSTTARRQRASATA